MEIKNLDKALFNLDYKACQDFFWLFALLGDG
jgi:hypothetical protein